MKPAAKKASPRNPIFVALVKRHGNTTTSMRDRRAPRGGDRNRQRDFQEGRY
jgi:hypothetical protein